MDIYFSGKELGIFVGKPTAKPTSFRRKVWAGQIQWEKDHHETLAALTCSSGRGVVSLRKTTGWPWAPDVRTFTEDVAPGCVADQGGDPPPPNMKSLKWQTEQAPKRLLQQDLEGANPSGFARQKVSARKDLILGTAGFFGQVFFWAGGFKIREWYKGSVKVSEATRMAMTLVGQDFLLGKKQVNWQDYSLRLFMCSYKWTALSLLEGV